MTIKLIGKITALSEAQEITLRVGEHQGFFSSEGNINITFDEQATIDLRELARSDPKKSFVIGKNPVGRELIIIIK